MLIVSRSFGVRGVGASQGCADAVLDAVEDGEQSVSERLLRSGQALVPELLFQSFILQSFQFLFAFGGEAFELGVRIEWDGRRFGHIADLLRDGVGLWLRLCRGRMWLWTADRVNGGLNHTRGMLGGTADDLIGDSAAFLRDSADDPLCSFEGAARGASGTRLQALD